MGLTNNFRFRIELKTTPSAAHPPLQGRGIARRFKHIAKNAKTLQLTC
jgi:hypothetical protein